MRLADHQLEFAAQLATDDEASDAEPLGLQIYRNAYRERLLSALETGFERTRQWVGADAFAAAACHYVISRPPNSWTLDAYGADFPAALEGLFAQDGEVAELAWLEWQLQQAFAAPDRPHLTGAVLAQAALQDDDWERLSFVMAAGYAARPIGHDCGGLWQALRRDELAGFILEPIAPGVLVVWRQGLTPHYRTLANDEFTALDCLVRGGSFGAVAASCGEHGAAALGGWFAQWLSEGLFADFVIG